MNKILTKYRFLYFSILLLVFGCTSSNNSTSESNSIAFELKYAKHFKIEKAKDGLDIVILDPENGKENRRFHSTDFQKNDISSHPIKIVILSSTHIGMLQVLGEAKSIVGVSNMSYVANQTVWVNHRKGKVLQFGEESNLPLEQIIAAKPTIIMYSGFGKEFPHQKQLEKLGIICIPNYDWRETHPLGKAEWVKLFGVIYGKQKMASIYFNSIEKEYLELTKLAKKSSVSKEVMSGNVMGDFWYTPAGESYNAHLLKDANCFYRFASTKGTGSLSMTLEEMLLKNGKARFWINPGAKSLGELALINPKAKFFKAFQDQEVYCYSNNANLFWEMGAVQPHKVLSDLIQITHPELNLTDKLYFYSKLSE